ncbi:CG31819 [Drosophila busckii]|uniref:CG31819 n=1 Tax=Drosophila busckii TaxID=30019 RepID=A0A0M3QZR1_DROBS|nr:uncharacterized protein LOC108606830 [Drosophila busckii]ALC49819.1 CG31819 [Drosophila busckii]
MKSLPQLLPTPSSTLPSLEFQRRKLRAVLNKLSLSDQLELYRYQQELRPVCDHMWRKQHKRLDFRSVERNLQGEPLSYFLNRMSENYRYVYFTADRLQENLNVLETAGIKALSNVKHCELFLSQKAEQKPPKPEDEQQQPLHVMLPPSASQCGAGDAGLGRAPGPGRVVGLAAVLGGAMMPQWPLHALPKMLRNLKRLKVHCEVQVHFIEQFPMLELLVLHGEIAQSALTGILERCKKLKRLFIKAPRPPSHLQGIASCRRLQDISLPLVLFNQVSDQIMPLPNLHLLELHFGTLAHSPPLLIDSMRYVLQHSSKSVEIMQLNCKHFESPYWMREAGLDCCRQLQGLVLYNCRFDDREISELNMPRVESYLVLSNCPDLKEYQLIDIVKRCSRLNELYLIDCPLLSGRILQGIYRIRQSEKIDYPINIILSHCDAISKEYQEAYTDYWQFKLDVLKLDRLLREHHIMEDLQIFFHKNQTDKS